MDLFFKMDFLFKKWIFFKMASDKGGEGFTERLFLDGQTLLISFLFCLRHKNFRLLIQIIHFSQAFDEQIHFFHNLFFLIFFSPTMTLNATCGGKIFNKIETQTLEDFLKQTYFEIQLSKNENENLKLNDSY